VRVDRAWAWAVIVVASLATASPLVPALRGHKGDSFPLSWFPMFAGERPVYETPTYVVGLTPSGGRVKVDVSFWTTGGFNQGRNMLTTAVKQHTVAALCDRIAKRVARHGRPEHADVTELVVVKGSYDRAKFFGGDRTPLIENTITRCPVVR
jgi:hypothetical protein